MRKLASALWNLPAKEQAVVLFVSFVLLGGVVWGVRWATGTLPPPTPKQNCSRLHNPSDDLSADASVTDQNKAYLDQVFQYQQCLDAGGTP